MSDIMTSLVNALNAVRNDYNDRLKTVPQYEAFLMVETSTTKAFDALRELLDAAKPSMAGDVISSLENAKSKFKEHLHSVAEYRALLALDKLIGDVSNGAEGQPTAAPASIASSESETSSQTVVEAPAEAPVAASTPNQAETAGTIATPESSAIQPDPIARVAAPPSSITPSVVAEAAIIRQETRNWTEISLAALAHAVSHPEGSAPPETEPEAEPSGLPGLPFEAMNVEAAAVSTDRDEDTTDDVAEEEDESDAGVIASSEYLPSTPYDSDAEKAA